MEKVSIIIPVYNVEEYLPRCLESCIAQTYRNIEILVVNDGSKDQSLQIIQSFQEKDPRVILIDKENQGLYRARISGVQKASGRFLFFLDGDDYLPSDAVECLLDKAVLHSMDLVVANFYKEENGVVTPIPSFFHEEGVLEREEFQKLIIDNTGDSLCGKLISKTLYDTAIQCPSFTNVTLGEDQVIMLQLCNNISSAYCCCGYSYYYVQRSSSIMHERNNRKLAEQNYYYIVGLFDMMDVNDYKAEIYYRILYRALSACCLYLRSSLLNEDKTNRVRGYVRDFYLNGKIVRRFVLDKNRLVAVMLYIGYFSPRLAKGLSRMRRLFS